MARWLRWSLSVAGPFVCRCLNSSALLRFHVPLLEPDVRIARIRLSFRLSGLRVRHVGPTGGDRIQPQRFVEIGQRVSLVPGAVTLSPSHQPPAHTHLGVPPEHPIGREHMAVVEVPAPASKDRVEYGDSFLRRPSPWLRRVGFRGFVFGACSVFTARCGPHGLLTPSRSLFLECFSPIVTS